MIFIWSNFLCNFFLCFIDRVLNNFLSPSWQITSLLNYFIILWDIFFLIESFCIWPDFNMLKSVLSNFQHIYLEYAKKFIFFLKKTYIFYSVHPPPPFCWGLNLQPNFQKGGLDRTSSYRGGLLGKRRGDHFFQKKKKKKKKKKIRNV